MKKRVLIIDTSILCVWLQVPGMESCGKDGDVWNYERVAHKIEEEQKNGTTFVLPLAAIIETGNHITHAQGDVYQYAKNFADMIKDSADNKSPWAAFTAQSDLWGADGLKALVQRWLDNEPKAQSLGDASIVDVAEYYARMGQEVEILTGDSGLKSYEPVRNIPIPRRRR